MTIVAALPSGWSVVGWGAVVLGVGAALAAWAWMSRLIGTERAGDDGFVDWDLQHALSAYVAAFATFLGCLWIIVGLTQVGVPAVVPLAGLAVVAAVLAVTGRRRRERVERRLAEQLAAAPDRPWTVRLRARRR